MDITLHIKLDAETLSAIQALVGALGGTASASQAATTSSKSSKGKAAEKDTGPVYWQLPGTDEFGKMDTGVEFEALKLREGYEKIIKVPESVYKKLEAENAARVKAAQEAAKAEKAEKSSKSKAASEETESIVTKEDLITTFTEFLPKDLDEDERTARREFVSGMLAKFKAKKVSELAEKHWAAAIEAVKNYSVEADGDESNEDDDLV